MDELKGPQDVFHGGGNVGALMRSLDWSGTPLGRPETWPGSLRSVLRMMLTSRYQMWMAWGADLTFFCNDAYRPTLGVKYPWAIGKRADAVWEEIWPEIGPLIDQVLKTGEATYSEGMLLFLERSGFPEETYHTFSYSPLFDDAGNIAGMFCVVVEETERVLSERRLGTLRKVASAVAAASSEYEMFQVAADELAGNNTDLPFTLTYVLENGGATARLAASSGISAGDSISPSVVDLADPPWPMAPILQGAQSVTVGKLSKRYGDLPSGAWDKPPETALIVPIGQDALAGFLIVGLNPYRPLSPTYTDFVGLLAGQIGAALATARAYDSERKRAEALAEIDRAKTTFFSNVSHEFRTPLTLMLGPLEDVLSQGGTLTPAEIASQVELAHRNGARLLRLVNSLLDFSRIEAGRVRAHFVPTDVEAFTAEIASTFRSAMEKAGLELRVFTEPLPAPVHIDREMWEKIVLNLLSNAFKFTFDGAVTVDIRPSEDGHHAEIRVADTGIGVAPEEVPRLFERFHRVAGAQGRTIEGTGIGLALVHELVRLHGGTISAESTVGKGTVFIVRLVFGTAHLPPEFVRTEGYAARSVQADAFVDEALRWLPQSNQQAAPAVAIVPSAADAPAGDAGVGKRILLADDNADMRLYVRRLLAADGYTVEAVEDGAAALESARAHPPDLVLSDVMMPRLDGFGLLRAIRSDPNIAGVPIILLSARAGGEAKVEGLDAGADDYLTKPFAARELLARVSASIQMARIRRESAREMMRSEQRFLMTNDRLHAALSTGRIAVFDLDAETETVTVIGPLTQFFGVADSEASRGLPLSRFLDGVHHDDRTDVAQAIRRSVETGASYDVEYRIVGGDKPRRVVARGSVQAANGPRRLLGAVIDISYEKETEDALRQQTRALEILNEAGTSVAAELDLDHVVQTVTDAGVALTKAEFGAFFYNVINQAGESYMLYSLSGVPREAFSRFPMPRNTAVFAPTFSGEAVVRSDDITKDPRYGRNAPRKGMPEGHLPVRSYLAVPVRSRNGEVLGGLFFGHSVPGQFDQDAETVMTGLAAQAAIAIDNARLYQAAQREIEQRRAAEQQLQVLNAGLEERVASEVGQRLQAEDALRQAQKMEAVGQLTGGIAHDFNNLLTIIIGGLDTIRRSGPPDDARLRMAVDMATQGARRAATLTARLLAFSRRQPLQPKPLDLNVIVRDSTELLHRTLGETIELEGVLAPRLWAVEADQNQLENAILNLAVNARDAMPNGGKLTIETANTMLDESYTATDAEVVPGQYVALSISDNGVGMSKDVIDRAFEPFYTTKDVGRGTGLGLSMVYGFVKQSGGHVTIYSETGQGTTVKLYFPRHRGASTEADGLPEVETPEGVKGETILVVEDNDDVRSYSRMVLSELGYRVLEAADAEAGMMIVNQPGRIDLLFTDVVLPGKTGRVLADEALIVRPGLKVLFTTGYSRNAIVHQGRLDPGVQLISKPFTFDELAIRVRKILDS